MTGNACRGVAMVIEDPATMDKAKLVDQARRHVLRTSPQRMTFVTRTDGSASWDQDGKRYLDFTSKAVCVNLGFANRQILDELHRQLEYGTYSAPYELNARQVELAA